MTDSHPWANPYISGLIPTICQWYTGSFQLNCLQLLSLVCTHTPQHCGSSVVRESVKITINGINGTHLIFSWNVISIRDASKQKKWEYLVIMFTCAMFSNFFFSLGTCLESEEPSLPLSINSPKLTKIHSSPEMRPSRGSANPACSKWHMSCWFKVKFANDYLHAFKEISSREWSIFVMHKLNKMYPRAAAFKGEQFCSFSALSASYSLY